jgi:exonuclease III
MALQLNKNGPQSRAPLKWGGGAKNTTARQRQGRSTIVPEKPRASNKIGAWNVRSLGKVGKLANVTLEMKRMGVEIMGVSETCWKGEGNFTTKLPESEGGDRFRVFYSGGEINRKGVGVIVREEGVKSILMCEPISERIMIMRLKVTPINVLIVQIYAPCNEECEEEKDNFYESLDQAIKDHKKGRECLMVMGDFNAKVGNNKEGNIVGPYGLGERNDNGDRLVNFCRRHNLFVTNTWFQQKRSAQHTWISPSGNIKNQIDYVLVDNRFRNGVQNSKSMPGADCESDHNPVIVTMKIRLQRIHKTKRAVKFNLDMLKKPEIRKAYRLRLENQLEEKGDEGGDSILNNDGVPHIGMGENEPENIEREIEEIWYRLKEGIGLVAEEICGKEQLTKNQHWMTTDILQKMKDRRECKRLKDEEGYKKLKHEIQRLCREAKDKYFEDKCKEIEMLDKAHNQLLYKKIKELRPKSNRMMQIIKSKQGKCLIEKKDIVERWAEYVEELYKDDDRDGNRDEVVMSAMVNELYTISCGEVETVIKELPKGKACGNDNIAGELLQSMGEKGIEIMTRLINKIYKSGYIPEEFRKSIFVPIPKINRAQNCCDYRTIALISHASKVLLHLIKRRITPIIERQLGESQMGFRKGKGTRDAIFQLRMISERVAQMTTGKEILNEKTGKKVKKWKKLFLCFVDYQKAFDRVKHDKLAEVMEKAGIPDLEKRLIINLYWKQRAVIRWDSEISREIEVERGVRQGCVISPLLFNLYSEFMIREAMENMEGIKCGGVNITDLRYADDAILVSDKRRKLQKMIDKLNDTCKEYGMDINVKKTKVMVMNKMKGLSESLKDITLNNVPLEKVARFKYLGSWITEDSRCEEDIRTRVGMAKAAFWQNKELMRRNIRLKTKIKILNCYVFSVLNYGCESWTWYKKMERKVDAFEMWCYRRILKISWKDKITNKEVLKRMHTVLHFRKDMVKRKMEYAGHVLRGSSGLSHLQILEGNLEGTRKQAGPKRMWVKDIKEWTGLKEYKDMKRTAEDRDKWRLMVVNLRNEDDR